MSWNTQRELNFGFLDGQNRYYSASVLILRIWAPVLWRQFSSWHWGHSREVWPSKVGRGNDI